jgi:hemolysin-activating ACP:hemolysin acyltransferase
MKQVDSEPVIDSGLRVLQLNATFEAFGIVMDYLAVRAPFSTFEAGDLVKAVRRQLRGGHHLVAMQGQSAVGYLGWMPTTNAIAQKWLDGTGQLKPADAASTDAVALTIVAADLPLARRQLIRSARMLNKTVRVYFKRGAENGRPARKVSLMSHNADE